MKLQRPDTISEKCLHIFSEPMNFAKKETLKEQEKNLKKWTKNKIFIRPTIERETEKRKIE